MVELYPERRLLLERRLTLEIATRWPRHTLVVVPNAELLPSGDQAAETARDVLAAAERPNNREELVVDVLHLVVDVRHLVVAHRLVVDVCLAVVRLAADVLHLVVAHRLAADVWLVALVAAHRAADVLHLAAALRLVVDVWLADLANAPHLAEDVPCPVVAQHLAVDVSPAVVHNYFNTTVFNFTKKKNGSLIILALECRSLASNNSAQQPGAEVE